MQLVMGENPNAPGAEEWKIVSEEGERLSRASVTTVKSLYCGQRMNTVLFGGVATPPQYRRHGYVRRLIERAWQEAPERGWQVAMLHPFSFSYYRKFGFEKISEHRILRFPMHALDFAERFADMVPVTDETRLDDLIRVFGAFSEGRNIMFPRTDARRFVLKPQRSPDKATYLYYAPDGTPQAYAVVGVEKHLEINRNVSDDLHVYETAFTSPEALYKVLGFLRMYEGELETVQVHDWAMMPELDMVLRHYTHTSYRTVPDIAARILDVKGFLEANEYPKEPGHFTLHVDDVLPYTQGTYLTEFGGGKVQVTRLGTDEPAEVTAPVTALAPLLYGTEQFTARNAVYLPGVRVISPETDLFRAFPKRYSGLFEHF